MLRWSCLLAGGAALWLAATVAAQGHGARDSASQPKMAVYESRYYIIHTDLDLADAREAAIRMTRMAEEYHARTADFSGTINQKLPFFLYRSSEDYYAAGALPGSAGCFNGHQLMAIAGEHPTGGTWHIVQHEGFHQFAFFAIGSQVLPTWLDEGLAEYFGEAVFTGDSFISGVIPPTRLRHVKGHLEQGPKGFMSITELMNLSHEKWNGELKVINYDQAWSLVQFLAHGEEGKYQKPFAGFIRQMSRGTNWQTAWHNSFGSTDGLEQHWRAFWKDLPERPTDELYAKANVTTLTGFLGRCVLQGQTFGTMEDFLSAIDAKTLKISAADWLPSDLIENAAATVGRRQEEGARYTILASPPRVQCVLGDGMKLTGSYTVRDRSISQVTVDVVEPKKEAAKK